MNLPTPLRSLLLCPLLLLAACGSNDTATTTTAGGGTTPPAASVPPPVATPPDYWPTTAWQTATPESHGFQTGALTNLATEAEAALPYYTSLLVIKDGYIVHESYHSTSNEPVSNVDSVHHLWSVTKSVTSLTVGRAWTLGAISNLDVTAGSVFPGAVFTGMSADDRRRQITLRHALQMRSGQAWNEKAWLTTTNDPMLRGQAGLVSGCPVDSYVTLCAILQQPSAYTPGTVWNYDTYDTYLVSAFFTGITGSKLNYYAAMNLFVPMGIPITAPSSWSDIGAYTFGGGLLYLRSRDIAKFGLLMMYGGKWEDTQLVSSQWLDMSLAAQGSGQIARFDSVTQQPSGSLPFDIRYGLQWWLKMSSSMTGTDAISAHGLAGQFVHVFRDKGLVIVVTCDSADKVSDRGTAINNFLQTHVLDKLAI